MTRKLQAITTVPQSLVDRMSEETWSKLEAIDVKARAPYLAAERIRKEIDALKAKLTVEIKRIEVQVEDAFELIGLEGQSTLAERMMCFPETKARMADQNALMAPYADVATLIGYWTDTGQKIVTLHDFREGVPTSARIAEVMAALVEHILPDANGGRRFAVAEARDSMVLHADGKWDWDCKYTKRERMTLEKAADAVRSVIVRDDRDWEEN